MKLFSVGSVLLSGVLLLQAPSTPPIKMGLWDLTVHSHMQNPPTDMGALANQNGHIRACYTLEKYREQVLNQRKGCTRTNEVWTSHSFSADVACAHGGGHFTLNFDSAESFTTTTKMTMQLPNHPDFSIESSGSGKYLGSDCGAITPDKPQVDMH